MISYKPTRILSPTDQCKNLELLICSFFSFFLSCHLFVPSPSSSSLLSCAPPSVNVDTSLLQWSLNCGTIPLVCPVGRNRLGCSVMLDPTEVTAAISRALQPHKVMFLNNSGGLRNQEHKAKPAFLLQYSLLCQSIK